MSSEVRTLDNGLLLALVANSTTVAMLPKHSSILQVHAAFILDSLTSYSSHSPP